MCTICFATQTFDPLRHGDGGDPTFANLSEDPDAPASILTTNVMSAGDQFSGTLSENGEEDWISIALTAGETYDISLDGVTLNDPLVRLFDNQGNQVALNDDGGPGLDSLLSYTADRTGTYFIVADAYSTGTGSYALGVNNAYVAPVAGDSGTLDQLAGFLTNGFWGGQQHTFNTNIITVSLAGLTAAGQQLARWAMDAWEMVANLDFRVVSSGEMITMDDELSGAFAYRPNSGSAGGVEMNVSTGWLSSYGTTLDSYSFQTYVHEIGHAIGLGHQGSYNGSATYGTDDTFSNDSWQMSVMSYFSQTENTSINASYAFAITPMMADIVAIQNLYGAPGGGGATAGDTIYGQGSDLGNYLDDIFASLAGGAGPSSVGNRQVAFTLYDTSGTDTIDLSMFNTVLRLDMRDAQFSDFGNQIGVMGIARGTVIENAVLGNGADRVTGNSANNVIDLAGGNDSLDAGAGHDSVMGGAGQDTINGDSGNDTLSGGAGADSLYGGSNHDVLDGGDGFDQLFGGDGNDLLRAGASADRVYGGAGSDVILGGSNFGLTVDGLWGDSGNDTIYGEGGFDMLDGGDGDDYLDGGHQADNLYGRNGNDIMYGDLGLDRLFGGNGHDEGHGGAGDDRLFGESGNDTLYGDAGQDRFYGGGGNDLIFGGADHDTVYGGAGFDTIHGGSGDDLLFGQFNADIFVFEDGHGQDTIEDFNALNNFERIDFSSVSAISDLGDLQLSNANGGAARQVGSDVVISTGGGNQVVLTDVNLSDLDSFDFIF